MFTGSQFTKQFSPHIEN